MSATAISQQAFDPQTCDILIPWILAFLAITGLLYGKHEALASGMWMVGMSVVMSCIPGMDLPLQLTEVLQLVGLKTGYLG